jgi:hypothetical protein
MSMPIQRQSEAYSVFDDGPRFARDRSSTDLPKGLAGLVNSMGPRITGGLLNTRQAAKEFHWQAHDDEFYPEVEGYSSPGARMLQKRLRDSQGNRPEPEPVDWDSIAPPKPKPRHARQAGYPSDGPRDHGGAGPDGGPSVPDSYYDDDDDFDGDPKDPPGTALEDPWGHRASRHPFDRTAACQSCGGEVYHISGEGFVHDDTDDHSGWEIDEHHRAEPDDDDDRNLGLSSAEAWNDREGRRVALAPAPQDPAAMAPQVPAGGGFQPAHRVGLPWRDSVIPGTVIGLDGPSVAVRWDDGQYSTEEPHNIQLL